MSNASTFCILHFAFGILHYEARGEPEGAMNVTGRKLRSSIRRLAILGCVLASGCGDPVRPMPSPSAIRLIAGTYVLAITASASCDTTRGGGNGFATAPFTLAQSDAMVTAHLQIRGSVVTDYVDISGTISGALLSMTFSTDHTPGQGRFGTWSASGVGT